MAFKKKQKKFCILRVQKLFLLQFLFLKAVLKKHCPDKGNKKLFKNNFEYLKNYFLKVFFTFSPNPHPPYPCPVDNLLTLY